MKTAEKPAKTATGSAGIAEKGAERPVPSYRRHKQSGQAITTLVDGLGRRRDVLLGKFGTRASRQEYARVIAEWEAGGRQLPARERRPTSP